MSFTNLRVVCLSARWCLAALVFLAGGAMAADVEQWGVWETSLDGPGEGRRPVAVLWSLEAERTVQLPAGKAATLTDLMGTSAPLTVPDAKAAVTLQPLRPVFVTIEE